MMSIGLMRGIGKYNSLIRLLLIILLISSFFLILKPLTYDYYPDFSYYYYATETLLNGGNPYIETITTTKLPILPLLFAYPPQAFFLFLPFSFTSYAVAGKLFTLMSIVCFMLSIILLFRIVKLKPFSNLGIFFVILSFNFFPAKFTLGMGQVNNFVLLAVVLFLYFLFGKRYVLSGILLTIAALIKVTPVVLFIYLIYHNKWKVLFSAAVSLLVISSITYFCVGHEVFFHFFLVTLPKLINNLPYDYYNQSLSGFILRSVDSISIQNLLRLIITLSLTAFSLLLLWIYRNKSKANLIGINILIILSLLLSSYSWQHHFVWLIVPLFLTFSYIKNNELELWYYIILGISYFLSAINLKNPLIVSVLFRSHLFFGGFFLYILNIHLLMRNNNMQKR